MTPTSLAALFMSAFLAVIPRVPQPQRGLIEQRYEAIAAMAAESSAHFDVPVGVLLTVGFLETHWGVDAREGGGWGAPVDMQHRHTAGTSDHAARALARSFEACHRSWSQAVSRFRSGLCVPRTEQHASYVRRVMGLVARTYAQAHQPLPEHLGTPPRVDARPLVLRTQYR